MFTHALEDHMPSLHPYASLCSILPFSCSLSHHIVFHFPILGMGHMDSFETWSLVPHFLLTYHLATHILSPFLPSTDAQCFSSIYHASALPCHWSLSILCHIRLINSFYPFFPTFISNQFISIHSI